MEKQAVSTMPSMIPHAKPNVNITAFLSIDIRSPPPDSFEEITGFTIGISRPFFKRRWEEAPPTPLPQFFPGGVIPHPHGGVVGGTPPHQHGECNAFSMCE